MTTLVIDTGADIVGVFYRLAGNFVAYRGEEIHAAIRRIAVADEDGTHNGHHRAPAATPALGCTDSQPPAMSDGGFRLLDMLAGGHRDAPAGWPEDRARFHPAA